MNDLVTVIITTYDSGDGKRTKALNDTLFSLLTKLNYGNNLAFIITDDSLPEVHKKHILETSIMLEDYQWPAQIINTNRSGVGFAKNNALKLAFETSDMIFMLEDDWELKEPLYLEKHVDVLKTNPEYSVIRFGYLGGTFDASYVDLGSFKYYWHLHRGSGVYIYSGQVSLRHKRFYEGIGWHLEGVSPGEEELDMCKRFNACENCGSILWPAEYGTTLNAGPFINIGLDLSTNHVKVGE